MTVDRCPLTLIIFAIMRMLLLYILLALLGQQTPFLESENLKTSESEKGSEPRAMSHEQRFHNAQSSQLEAQCPSQVFSFSVSQILYFENQIRLADSLYKNYLPQYNFEEVKAAVMFFDSLRLTTDLLESENLKNSESEKSCEQRAMSNEPFLESEKSVNISEICGNEKTNHRFTQKKSERSSEQRAMSNEPFLESEKSVNISEICGNEKTNHRLVQKKSEKSCEPRAMSHEQRFRKAQSSQHEAQSLKKTVDCCPLSVDIEYLCARAHYYHAVGLTERDDIVGACEHYFKALEIMETELETENMKTSKSWKGSEQRAMSHEQKFRNAHSSKLEAQSPDYEKIRFLSLIYTRLGELFYSENYCNLAISKYRKALRYILLLGENKAVANTYKCLGNSYQLYDMPDSALYYYNMSIKTDSNLTNRLDVEKSIAKILFEKGEKDKAYILLKNNLNKLNNYKTKDSYYVTLGEMYYSDLIYDSATYFLKISSNSNNYSIKATSLGLLSTIYDSIDNHVEKAYCDNILSKLLLKSSNKTTHSTKLQSVYDEYKERKHEREKLENNRRTYIALLMFALFVVLTFIVTLLLWYINKRKSKVLMTAILDNENLIIRINEDIKQKEAEIERLSEDNLNKGEVIDAYIENIEKTTTEINELKKDVNEKEIRIGELLENIKVKDEQISNYKEQTVNAIKADINSYYETEICEKILLEVKYKNTNKVKKITLNKLKPKEIVSLKYAANSTLNHLLNKITSNYRKIDNEDLICICLLLLDISITDISELMGKSYNAVWTRITKIKNTFKLDADSNLQSFLLGLL